MITKREFLQASVAATGITGLGGAWTRASAQQALTEDALIDMPAVGNVTLMHIADIHAQLKPIYYREPSINIGVGSAHGKPPHVTGEDFLKMFDVEPGSPHAYALTSSDFASLAQNYGRMGGIDRVATVVNRIRADRPNALLLDGGDTWQGSYTANQTKGQDMITVMNALKPDAMTSHWEFTYGGDYVREVIEDLPFPFLGANVYDKEWDEPALEPVEMFEQNGVKIAVIGQAFPYLPIANPGWMFPNLSFGIREKRMQEVVNETREEGAELVVLLSHNGFDVDRKLASRVAGIDVILTGHTHDALPEPIKVGNTMLVASGSNGKFVSRLDLDVRGGVVKDFGFRLIPVFSDVITPDPDVAALIDKVRKPYADELSRNLGATDGTLYRRGNFNGTWDDLICDALLSERDAEIALSPGFRWGPSLLPGQDITVEDLHNATAMTYPSAYRSRMTGEFLKVILEDVCDNLFNPDPYYQQGGDMVRAGGMGYRIDVRAPAGERISNMTHLATGKPIDAAREYTVAGWGSVIEETEGPPIWDVVEAHLKDVGTVSPRSQSAIEVIE